MQFQISQLLIGLIGIPAFAFAVILPGEMLLRRLAPVSQARLRPWLWLSPVLAMTGVVIAYPLEASVAFAFQDATSSHWVGFDNFVWAFRGAMRSVLFNNLLWIVVFPAATL